MEKKKVEEANTYKEMEQVVRIPSNHFYFLHLITGCVRRQGSWQT